MFAVGNYPSQTQKQFDQLVGWAYGCLCNSLKSMKAGLTQHPVLFLDVQLSHFRGRD